MGARVGGEGDDLVASVDDTPPAAATLIRETKAPVKTARAAAAIRICITQRTRGIEILAASEASRRTGRFIVVVGAGRWGLAHVDAGVAHLRTLTGSAVAALQTRLQRALAQKTTIDVSGSFNA